jgi:hypothetical protein
MWVLTWTSLMRISISICKSSSANSVDFDGDLDPVELSLSSSEEVDTMYKLNVLKQ